MRVVAHPGAQFEPLDRRVRRLRVDPDVGAAQAGGGRRPLRRGCRPALLGALAVLLSACGSGPRRLGSASASAGLECAPYARQASGIRLYGEAYSWWEQAAGRYDRGSKPMPGSVLVFRRSGRLGSGHVSVVERVVSDREITVTQANWVPGRVSRDEPVVDVSPGNDWSAVRVWWAPSLALGLTTYPTYGFIGPAPGGAWRDGGRAAERAGS